MTLPTQDGVWTGAMVDGGDTLACKFGRLANTWIEGRCLKISINSCAKHCNAVLCWQVYLFCIKATGHPFKAWAVVGHAELHRMHHVLH